MATLYWLGRAKNVADVWTFTVAGTISASETFTITCNGKAITFTATTTTIAHVVAGLLALLQATDAPAEFAEMTWTSNGTDVITGTANTAGVPHTFSASDTSAGSITAANATAATGENFVNNTANWSTGALPTNGDIVHFQRDVSALYGWSTLSGVTVAELHIWASYETGQMRLPFENANGYTEYRGRYATIGATSCIIGEGEGQGPSGISIDFGSVQTAVEVLKSQITNNPQEPAIILKGTHASNTLEVRDAEVSTAAFGGESANWDVATQSGGRLVVGDGAAVGEATHSNCEALYFGSVGELYAKSGANVRTENTTEIAVMEIDDGGNVDHRGGDIDQCTLAEQGNLDVSGDNTEKTINDLIIVGLNRPNDPHGILTINDVTLA